LKILQPRPSPLTNKYVLDACEKQDPSPQSLLYKLQESKGAYGFIETAAECMVRLSTFGTFIVTSNLRLERVSWFPFLKNLQDHLAAGIDTTGDGLCFLMHQLSLPENTHIQTRLQMEVSAKDSGSLDDLPYLDAVIKEGLRCFPPIPMSAPRYVPVGGRTIDGYFIPQDTIVSCQAWSVHRLNEAIYPDGDKFFPERWLEKKGNLDMNRLFFAFGGGGRGCIGRQ
jgi:hypothetical protein